MVQKVASEKEILEYADYYKRQDELKKVQAVRRGFEKDISISNKRKALYYFILVLSAALLFLTLGLGIKFDGVSITRSNQTMFEVITEVAEARYPEKRSDKFDVVYFTLNYHVQKDNYYMTGKELSSDLDNDGVYELDNVKVVNSVIYQHYITNELPMDMSNDHTYSGVEFNNYFKYSDGRYVDRKETIKRIGYILGRSDITDMDDLISAYLNWDIDDSKSNKAYNWEVMNEDGGSPFDGRAEYLRTYLRRNGFIRLFLNEPAKFVHEYNLFQSVGWLTWSSLAVLILYIILAFSIWLIRRDNLKISKGLVKIIIILSVLVMTPLILQYFFEGLSKEADELLNVVENTKFTTTTIFMNFVFSYVMKFSNIVLTGILTVALPMKVIRYFAHNAIHKTEEKVKALKTMTSGGSLLDDAVSKSSYRV